MTGAARWRRAGLPYLLAVLGMGAAAPVATVRGGTGEDAGEAVAEGGAALPEWALAHLRVGSRPAGEDAVVHWKEWDFARRRGRREGSFRRLVEVLTEDGRADATLPVARGHLDSFDRLKLWVREPGGRVVAYGDVEGLAFGIARRTVLDETEVVVLGPPGVAPGSVVAQEWRWSSDPGIPQDVITIQESIPVLRATVTMASEDDWVALARFSSGSGREPEVVPGARSWDFEEIPAKRRGPGVAAPSPSLLRLTLDHFPAGETAPFATWQKTAEWAHRLFSQAETDGPRPRGASESLRSGGGDPVRRAMELVRDLRYFAVAIGWGGYVPRPPETTLARGFGDCKDKSVLLVSLLAGLDVAAWPVLISAPEDNHVDRAVAGPRQFNHAVVAIDWRGREVGPGMTIVSDPTFGSLRIFDPTLSPASPQDVPVTLENALGLVVDPRSPDLIRLPQSRPEDNIALTTAVWTLDGQGRLSAVIRRSFGGVQRQSLEGEGSEALSGRRLREREFAIVARDFPGSVNLVVEPVERSPGGSWSYRIAFQHPAALVELGELRLLRLPDLAPPWLFPLPDEKSTEPVHLPFRGTLRQVDEIHGGGASVVHAPEPLAVESQLGSVVMGVERTADGIRIERRLTLLAAEVPRDRAQAMFDLQDGLRRVNGARVVLGPTADGNRDR